MIMIMDAKSRPKINIHGHLHLDPSRKGDLPTRIKRWQEWNVRYFCCLCVSNRPSSRLPGVFVKTSPVLVNISHQLYARYSATGN